MSEILNKTILLVGKKGCGKTTLSLKLAIATVKRIVVVDTQVHPTYADAGFVVVPIHLLHISTEKKIIVCHDDIDSILKILDKTFSNAFIILEDANRYLSQNLTKAQTTFLLNHRQRNFDILFSYHYLSAIPPALCKNYDKLVLFKTLDNLEVKLLKFPNWHIVKEMAIRVNKNNNPKYCEYINGD